MSRKFPTLSVPPCLRALRVDQPEAKAQATRRNQLPSMVGPLDVRYRNLYTST